MLESKEVASAPTVYEMAEAEIEQLTADIMRSYRIAHDLSQTEFARVMGMPFRTYQGIECGEVEFRSAHKRAAMMALMLIAARDGTFYNLPASIAKLVTRLYQRAHLAI
jgi:transcriptional regulator with XRE-family HTH domain